jgi:molybdopterin/thiamine biosynthesis adenylyltransferase
MEELDQDALALLESVMEEQHKEIPENNKSYIISDATSRFSGALWYEEIQKQNVILAGVGGIGSWLALLLARMNVDNIMLYDPDIVEEVNMAGQLYSAGSIGNAKVTSIINTIQNYARYYKTSAIRDNYTSNSNQGPIMICGFDNMAARKVFFRRWLSYVNSVTEKDKCLFIDGRLNAEEFQVLAITGDNTTAIKEYSEKWLFDDSEVEEAVCSYKQTTFMSNMIASVMANIFVNHVANMCKPVFPRDVPFFTAYSADTMYTNTIVL